MNMGKSTIKQLSSQIDEINTELTGFWVEESSCAAQRELTKVRFKRTARAYKAYVRKLEERKWRLEWELKDAREERNLKIIFLSSVVAWPFVIYGMIHDNGPVTGLVEGVVFIGFLATFVTCLMSGVLWWAAVARRNAG